MMKQVQKIILFIPLILILTSCTKDFEEINTNPLEFSIVDPSALYNYAVKNTINHLGGTLNRNFFMNYSHLITIVGGSGPHYGLTANSMDAAWKGFYVSILQNISEIKKLYEDDENFTNRVLIAEIWEAYVYSVVVSLWGGVPKTDALINKEPILYDAEIDIYNDILNTLKESAEKLDITGDVMKTDPIFEISNNPDDNDKEDYINNWKKFANTVRLMVALRCSNLDAGLAEEHAKEVMANEDMLISSNDEIIKASWTSDLVDNWNWFHREYKIAGRTVQIPFLSHFGLLYLRGYNDPRLEVYADTVEYEYSSTTNTYKYAFFIVDTLLGVDSIIINDTNNLADNDTIFGTYLVSHIVPYVGQPKSDALSQWDLRGADVPYTGLINDGCSPMDSRFYEQDLDYIFISYAQTCFMKAEAALYGWGGSKTAEQYYQDGIIAAFEQYDLNKSQAESYMNQDGIKWGTTSTGIKDFRTWVSSAIPDDPLTKIITQRWLNNFFYSYDAWCIQRRTRILNFPPHTSPGGSHLSYKVMDIPERWPYPNSEILYNKQGYLDAINWFDGDNDEFTYLGFSKQYEKRDWLNENIILNLDVERKWYGDYIQSYWDAGIKCDTIMKLE